VIGTTASLGDSAEHGGRHPGHSPLSIVPAPAAVAETAYWRRKTARTERDSDSTGWQTPVPVQAPAQPEKTLAGDGTACSRITLCFGYLDVQFSWPLPQEMSARSLVTRPAPPTVTSRSTIAGAKVAVATAFAFRKSVHFTTSPRHAPDHPTKREPSTLDAVNHTAVPFVNVAEHFAPHEIVPERLVTRPGPLRTIVSFGLVTDPRPPADAVPNASSAPPTRATATPRAARRGGGG
jgi:hypothetical protein